MSCHKGMKYNEPKLRIRVAYIFTICIWLITGGGGTTHIFLIVLKLSRFYIPKFSLLKSLIKCGTC